MQKRTYAYTYNTRKYFQKSIQRCFYASAHYKFRFVYDIIQK